MDIQKVINDDGEGWYYSINYEDVKITPDTLVLYSAVDAYIVSNEDFYLCNNIDELIQLLRTFSLAIKNKKIEDNNSDEEYLFEDTIIQKTFIQYEKLFKKYNGLFTEPQQKNVVESFNAELEKSKSDLAYGRAFINHLDEFSQFYCMGNIQSALEDDYFQECLRTSLSVMEGMNLSKYHDKNRKIQKRIDNLLKDDKIEKYVFKSPKDDDLIVYAISEIQDGALGL